MKGIRIFIMPLLALLVASCAQKQEVVIQEKPVSVTVASASLSDLAISRVYTGTLEGWKQARIYASIPEAVVSLPVQEGNPVRAGQTVIQLDQSGPASQLRQAKARYNELQDNHARMSRLFEQGAIPEQTLINLKANLDVARANYESARQQVELTSPISGVLTDLSVNVGQYAPVGVPLATVAQTDKLRLTLYVDARSVAFLKEGQTARISVATVGQSTSDVEGQVVEISRSADPATRLFRVELQIGNQDGRQQPGMFARAAIVVQELDSVLTVPRETVFFVEGIPKVYTINDSSRAAERNIEIGENTLEHYQVLSGLAEGEKVILLGKSQVEDGGLVKVVEETSAAATSTNFKKG